MENKEELEKIVNDLVTICDSHSSISDCRLVARKYGIKCPDIGCDGCKARMFDIFRDKLDEYLKPDGLSYPLDKDGVPIKLGDTVYRADGKRPFEYQIFNNCEYGMTVETISLHRDHIEITCDYYGCTVYYEPKQLTHFKPRTLDDILQDAESRVYYGKDTGNTVDELIKEAYDLGLSDGAKKDE